MQAEQPDSRSAPEPLLADAKSPWKAIIRSSWAEAREVHPFLALVRVIHLQRKVQLFIPLSPMTRAEDYELEGETLFTPTPEEGFTPERRAEILREYDAGPYIPRR